MDQFLEKQGLHIETWSKDGIQNVGENIIMNYIKDIPIEKFL